MCVIFWECFYEMKTKTSGFYKDFSKEFFELNKKNWEIFKWIFLLKISIFLCLFATKKINSRLIFTHLPLVICLWLFARMKQFFFLFGSHHLVCIWLLYASECLECFVSHFKAKRKFEDFSWFFFLNIEEC